MSAIPPLPSPVAQSPSRAPDPQGAAPQAGQGAPEDYHYRVILRALAEIDAAGGSLPLEDLSRRMGMSPAHFQRLFSRWVGVSPKRYQQYLALDAARRLLAERHSTLEAALRAGLSGAGRLHDLFLRWEAMSPGAYARAGAGMTIRHGVVDTPFGPAVAMATGHGLCGLGFAAPEPATGTGAEGEAAPSGPPDGPSLPKAGLADSAAVFADLAARWPGARFVHDPGAVAGPVTAAFARGGRPPALHAMGGPFQIKVWEALLAVPEGHVTTYSDIARAIGHPRAVRAVGTAVGRNPLGWLIPCHRALRRSGALGGYRWGLPVKRAMLAWEAARTDAAPPPVPRSAPAGPPG